MHEEETGRDWNEGAPDHEGEMAVSQLHRTAEMAEELLEIIGEGDELPGWVQYKLSRSYSDLNDVYGYIESRSHEIEEGRKKKKRGLWANIHARRKAGKRPHRPGEKGYPKTLDIESSQMKELRRMVGEVLRELQTEEGPWR